MNVTVDLYEPIHDHLKIRNKRGTAHSFVYVVKIGPLVKICPSEASAFRYLRKNGFVYGVNGEWILKFKSEGEMNLENNYKKH